MHVSAVVHPKLEIAVYTDLIAVCNSKRTIYSDLLNPVLLKLLRIPALLA